MTLEELIHASQATNVRGSTSVAVTGVSHDSRIVASGDVFFALQGYKTDGNRHIKEANQRGAVAIVSELEPPPAPLLLPATWVQVSDVVAEMGRMADFFFGRPSSSLKVTGITGTNGKTTVSYFLESIIAVGGGQPSVVGTVNHRYRDGERLVELGAPNTTPISLELLRILSKMRDTGTTHAILEISSHALALRRVDEIEFDVAVFTNLTRDHLDFHKTPEAYLEAKGHLFELLSRPSSNKTERTAVLNADDPAAGPIRRHCMEIPLLSFSLDRPVEVTARKAEFSLTGTRFELVIHGRPFPASLSLLGRHNLSNALAAAAAALALGFAPDTIVKGLSVLERVPGRLEPVDGGQDFNVFVDYAHTEDALSSVLTTLKELPHKRLITVFGCGGERDKSKRGPMGITAASKSHEVVVTSDNPRGEDPLTIIGEIEAGLKKEGLKNYRIRPDRREAIAEAVAMAGPGDIVLIAGKGHEDYQILKHGRIDLDDREAARTALKTL